MSDTRALRVLIVGCGRIAGGYNEQSEAETLTHVLAYRRSGADVVGCCDIDPAIAAAFAARWQIPHQGTQLDALLRASLPDVVSIATPPVAQEAAVGAATRCASVRGILIEKPFGQDGDAAGRIAARLRDWERPAVINFFRAFDPCYQGISAEVRERRFGTLRHAVGRYYGPARTNASHLIERVLDLFGGSVGRCDPAPGPPSESPAFTLYFDHGQALFLPSGGLEYSPFELDLLFERARIRVVDAERRVERFGVVPDPDYPGYTTLAPDSPGLAPSTSSFVLPFEAILRAARDGAAVAASSIERSVAVTRILDHVLLQRAS